MVTKRTKKIGVGIASAVVGLISVGADKAIAHEAVRPDYNPVAQEYKMSTEELQRPEYGYTKNLGEIMREIAPFQKVPIKKRTPKKQNFLKKIGGVLLGATAGMVCHEGGHWVTGKLSGDDVSYDPFRHPTNYDTPGEVSAWTSAGGLIAQTLATEILLNSGSISKDNAFVQGFVGFNTVEGFRYGVAPNIRKDTGSDVNELGKKGVNQSALQTALVAHGIYSAYRLAKESQDLQDNVNIWITPTEGGMAGGFKYKF